MFQVRQKALTAIAILGAKAHTYARLLILDANSSMSGFPNLSTVLWNSSGWSFHLVASRDIVDYLSASILFLPGICAAEAHNLFSM